MCSPFFFSIDTLPLNTIEYIRDALQAIACKNMYAEEGWDT